MDGTVLIVDDDEALTRSISRRLANGLPDLNFVSSNNTADALLQLAESKPHVAVVDLSIDESAGPRSGLTMIEEMVRLDPTCRIIVVTGHTDSQYGIAALKAGAASFVSKPPEIDHLQALVVDGVIYSKLKRENIKLREQSAPGRRLGLTSSSPLMSETIQQAEFAAEHTLPVLITGETGVGKGVLASAIHRASRRKGSFIRFQPSLRGSELISSELFGHERGAFTGAVASRVGLLEEANNGTLFIDEIDELPNEVQVMLLDALQSKSFKRLGGNREIASNFRIVSATNHSVESSLNSGKLREDFLHRIAQQRLPIPPLRERPEDIEQLATGFVAELANREKMSVQRIDSAGIAKLTGYAWPGNVRELQAVVEIACYRAHLDGRPQIGAEDIIFSSVGDEEAATGSFRAQVQAFEQRLVVEAMRKADNNQSKAAQALGLDRTSLRRILSRNGE